MNTTNKILIVALVSMVVLNIGTLGFIYYKSQHHKRFVKSEWRNEFNKGEFLSKRLNFTEEQEVAFRKLRKEHKKEKDAVKAKIDSLRKQEFELLKNDPYDATTANVLASEIGANQKEIELLMSKHFLAVKALCTKEQLSDFNELIDHIKAKQTEENGYGHARNWNHKRHGEGNYRNHCGKGESQCCGKMGKCSSESNSKEDGGNDGEQEPQEKK
ncbi:MAG TPA: periplasmic heavy metal sensor [Cytophagaceae bacterium]|jgi:Spy/CpxP family protein refolding chaperone|nr:periplasmic heavy metal sensor [Cytophagaceae bacterium]